MTGGAGGEGRELGAHEVDDGAAQDAAEDGDMVAKAPGSEVTRAPTSERRAAGSKGAPLRAVQANDAGRAGLERGDHVELASELLDRLPSDATPIADLGSLHTYRAAAGVWCAVDRSDASRIVQGFAGCAVGYGDKPKPMRIRAGDVGGAITLAQDQVARPGFFDDATPGLAFSNGFVRLDGNRIAFEPHSPEHAARFSYAFHFDAAAPRSRWLACLADAFKGDDDAADKIACLQEFAGASLFGLASRYQRAIVMFGEGSNAKSTIARVIAAAFPPGSTCAVAPQKWGDEYRLALMAGKLLNVVSELPEADILEGETFKAMISGDAMTARPIREAPFPFSPRAGHLFAANKLPGSNDQSHGFWRRMIVLVFKRVFAEHEQNASLAEQIIAAELAGVVAWAIEGAQRIAASGRYTVPTSSAAALKSWKRGADPVAQFVAEKTRPARTNDDRSRAVDLFAAYVEWAEANKFRVMSSHTFGMRMRGIGQGSEHTRAGEVYPVALLRMGEVSPAIIEAAEREEAAAATRNAPAVEPAPAADEPIRPPTPAEHAEWRSTPDRELGEALAAMAPDDARRAGAQAVLAARLGCGGPS